MPNFGENLPELFEKVNKAESEDEKIALLQGYKQQATLQTILQSAYGRFTWALPEGRPPFRESDLPYGMGGLLDREIRKFVYFFNEHPRKIEKVSQRESVFIQMLENLHPSESEVVLQAKEGDVIGAPHALVHKAFPGLVEAPPEPKKPAKKKAAKKKATKKKTDE